MGPQGESGPQGETGEQGPEGDSAYDVWLNAGNTGTEQDFLDGIVGGSVWTAGGTQVDSTEGVLGTWGAANLDWITAGVRRLRIDTLGNATLGSPFIEGTRFAVVGKEATSDWTHCVQTPSSNTGVSLGIHNSGEGHGLYIQQDHPTSTVSAMWARSMGQGRAAYFSAENALNERSTVTIESEGLGHGLFARTANASNSSATLRLEQLGSGPAFVVESSGAAMAQLFDDGQESTGLFVSKSGNGEGVRTVSTANRGFGIWASSVPTAGRGVGVVGEGGWYGVFAKASGSFRGENFPHRCPEGSGEPLHSALQRREG